MRNYNCVVYTHYRLLLNGAHVFGKYSQVFNITYCLKLYKVHENYYECV